MNYTVTAKLQISVSETNKQDLIMTMKAYTRACNFVSAYIFETHDLKQASVNKALYHTLRDEYGLRSQMSQSVIKTVIARYKTILENQKDWIKPFFKKLQYDLVWNRDYSLVGNQFSVNALNGRLKVSYYDCDYMQKYFNKDVYQFGTAKLVSKHGKFFLHVPVICEIDDCNLNDVSNVVGIDLGINFLATTYDSKHQTEFHSGRQVKQKRAHYKRLRKQLQQVKSPSSRRRLKAIGQRENRWMNDVNHCLSKALVASQPEHTLFVLEDLSNVRKSTEKVRTRDRYVFVSWSYYDLGQKIMYKSVKKSVQDCKSKSCVYFSNLSSVRTYRAV